MGISGSLPELTPEQMTSISRLVKGLINDNTVMVFSKLSCPYCSRTKSALSKENVVFKVIELDNEDEGSAIQSYLQTLTKQRTVPNIFINGNHVGGCDDLLAVIRDGKLKDLVDGPKAQL